ncbi:hypothetical protein EDD21DRAFT_367710 [Dissophora ornata]|nr:hypothetical protein EDD21DRAFT_367710 [Dissophora ornata]
MPIAPVAELLSTRFHELVLFLYLWTMKKLSINLSSDGSETPAFYLPGDTIKGHAHLTTSSSVKYSCIKAQFIGLVSTKLAKTEDQAYILSQQVVLLGNANNESEYVIEEGKYVWPFTFTIPRQHHPSSGKYRHGAVKYTLTVTLASAGFMGGMQELKASQTIQVKDLINIMDKPYSNPISVKGDSHLRPESDNPRNTATALVKLPRSAFLKGQRLNVEIELYHPFKVQRDPGCFIQLVRRERYFAGDQAKEYMDTIASCAEALVVDSNLSTGKIASELTVPDIALPTMTTTKIMSIEYELVVLFDMRPKKGFMESRHGKTVKSKMRNKLLSSPGGIEVHLPIFIGTLSDSSRAQRPALTSRSTSSSGSPAAPGSPARSLPSMSPSPKSSPGYPRQPLPTATPEPPGYNFGRFTEGESSRRHATDTLHVQAQPNAAPYPSLRNRSHSAVPGTAPSHFPPADSQTYATHADIRNKPLPLFPQTSTHLQPSPIPSVSSPASMSPPSSGPSMRPAATTAPAPQLPPRSQHPNLPRGPGSMPALGRNGYPREKDALDQHRELPLPIAMTVEMPTAPLAMDLGLGPASPRVENLRGDTFRYRQSSAPPIPTPGSTIDYFQLAPRAPQMALPIPPTAPPMFLSPEDREYVENNRHAAYSPSGSEDASGYSYRR